MVYGPTDFSDGTIRFIALATLFLQPTPPKVIIIDEPELGLHPVAIQKLSGMMHVAAQKVHKLLWLHKAPTCSVILNLKK